MRVLPPIDITDSVLTYSSLPEPTVGLDPNYWISTTTYLAEAEVSVAATHKIYKNITGGAVTGGFSPDIDVTRAIPKWAEIGSTNRWGMFDIFRNTASVYSETVETVVLLPGVSINSVAMLGLVDVGSITIICSLPGSSLDGTVAGAPVGSIPLSIDEYGVGIELYNKTFDMTKRVVYNWWTFFFSTFTQRFSLLAFDLPEGIPEMIVTIIIRGSPGMKVGSCIVGTYTYIGSTQNGATSELLNFSVMEKDAFGATILVPRRSVPKLNVNLLIPKEIYGEVITLKNTLDAIPALWVGMDDDMEHPYFESLLVFGIYREFTFKLDNPILVKSNLEVEEI